MGDFTGRSYDMSNRARAAGETRRRIVDAAARLFDRDGYAPTSIAAIAREAQVAVPTVYATLRSKAGVLQAVVDATVRGEDDARPLSESAEWREMEAEPDPERKLARFARIHRGICEREAGIFAAMEAAAGADPDAGRLLAEHDRRRYETQRRLAHSLGLDEPEAADVIWTIASERTYLALVRARGWEPAAYERWVAAQLAAALLRP
jgi:TetR/AcrR family transcriptional regulator, regulator of autoinduction and epiphytic fitness